MFLALPCVFFEPRMMEKDGEKKKENYCVKSLLIMIL